MEYLSNLHILLYRIYIMNVKQVRISMRWDHINFILYYLNSYSIYSCYYSNSDIKPNYTYDLSCISVNKNELLPIKWSYYKAPKSSLFDGVPIMLNIAGFSEDFVIGRVL